jgi:hypothetical protein
MRDCVILSLNKWQTGFSLTHNSLLVIQPPTSPHSSSPIYVRVLVRVVGTVWTVEKVFFVCRVLATEHLIVLVHDIFDREFCTQACWPLSKPCQRGSLGLTLYHQQRRVVLLPRLYPQQERAVPPKKTVVLVLKFLELSLSTIPQSLSWVWVLSPVCIQLNSL